MTRLAATAVLCIGCGYPELPSLVDSGSTTTDIHGVGTVHAMTDTAMTDRPRDFSTHFALFSITPEGGGFKHRTGTGTAAGTFDVPVGSAAASWYLGDTIDGGAQFLVVGNAMMPDFSYTALGRTDTAFPASATYVTVNASGLDPWQSADDLEILSSNAGSLWFS